MEVLNELIINGNSVIVVEHDSTVLSYCDWIIELGSEGGINEGDIIAKGAPKNLRKNEGSKIGFYIV